MAVNPVKAQIGICPGCGARIRFQAIELGEFIVCEECGDELEVVRLNPIKLDWAYADPYEVGEWDDDNELWQSDSDYDHGDDDDQWDD
jgi:lysine biosynthesis protein LysW